MKISFVRGAYLNNFEGQNYPNEITGYSSLWPIDSNVPFHVIKLPSIADLQTIPLLSRPIKYIANRTLGDSQLLFGLERYIRGSDIVHVADPHYYYSYQAARLKKSGTIKKLISTWCETIPYNNESVSAKKRIKKYTMEQVDMFVCNSERARECLLKEGVIEQKISVIPLGVNLESFRPKSKNIKNGFTILFVGRLVEEKGILDLLEAFKQSVSNKSDLKLKIVGDGPLYKRFHFFIHQNGLQTKMTVEHKLYTEMPEMYRQADVFCAPSKKTPTWEEQYGMVFIEAMASGLPIISYSTGSIPLVVKECGLLTKEEKIDELTKSIDYLYSHGQLCHKIGTMGRERAGSLYDAKKTQEKMHRLYKTLD